MSNPLDDVFGPACLPRSTGPKVWTPPKTADGSITVDMFNTQKTLDVIGVKRVVTATKEDKKRAREEAAAAATAAQKATVTTTPQSVVDEELRQVEQLIAQMEEDKKIFEKEEAETAKRRKEAEEDGGIEKDGTELPQTFAVPRGKSVIEEEQMFAVSADAMYADQRDAKMSTALFYGQGCFPVDTFVAFVTHNGRVKLEHCELAFVFNGAWWRNRRFGSALELRAFIERRKPERIDIGPVAVPGQSKMRYLVFDTDLEDVTPETPAGYIRTCKCKGTKKVCSQGCWFYMRVAIKCLTYVMRKVFDAKHVVAVSSGRRGVHTWVLDEKFLALAEDERKGIVKRVELLGRPWEYEHPEYTGYIYTHILKPAFERYFLDGPILICAGNTQRKILEVAEDVIPRTTVGTSDGPPDDDVYNGLHQCIADLYHAPSVADRKVAWKRMCKLFDPRFKKRLIFMLLYPRLDVAVTTSMTHCIKAPFVVHPESKRCCVPIPNVETWGPHMAPRLSELAVSEDELANPYGWRGGGGQDELAGGKGAVLTDYVNHLSEMLSRAFPYPDHH